MKVIALKNNIQSRFRHNHYITKFCYRIPPLRLRLQCTTNSEHQYKVGKYHEGERCPVPGCNGKLEFFNYVGSFTQSRKKVSNKIKRTRQK